MNSILMVLVFVAVAAASPHLTVGTIPNSNYEFHYAVNDPSTGDNKAQWEVREGDVVQGAYSLVDPDGSIRIVEYTADPGQGFNAVVKRVGPNIHTVPIAPVAPIVNIAPVIQKPVQSSIPIYDPITDPWNYLNAYAAPASEPWVSVSGKSYGARGNIVQRWKVAPITNGEIVTIRTKH